MGQAPLPTFKSLSATNVFELTKAIASSCGRSNVTTALDYGLDSTILIDSKDAKCPGSKRKLPIPISPCSITANRGTWTLDLSSVSFLRGTVTVNVILPELFGNCRCHVQDPGFRVVLCSDDFERGTLQVTGSVQDKSRPLVLSAIITGKLWTARSSPQLEVYMCCATDYFLMGSPRSYSELAMNTPLPKPLTRLIFEYSCAPLDMFRDVQVSQATFSPLPFSVDG